MQGEGIFEDTYGKCHMLHFCMQEDNNVFSMLTPCVICVHFSRLVGHCVRRHTPRDAI